MSGAMGREVTFHVFRYAPGAGAEPWAATYVVPANPGMTVLDGLNYIKEHHDPSLAWRSSCRMGVCGSCAMLINGVPSLACNTQILEVAGGRLALRPLPNFEVIRDLVPDLAPMFRKHRDVTPFIVGPHAWPPGTPSADGLERAEGREGTGVPHSGPGRAAESDTPQAETAPPESRQSVADLERYLQFSFCIKCGCCMAACPTLATDQQYLGPMPLAQALRYSNDTRDSGGAARAAAVGSRRGVFACHYAGECSRVCPKGVDPAKAIQLAKRRLVAAYLGFARKPGLSNR